MSNTANQVSVVITADNHKHQGKPAPKGSRLTVAEHTAQRMVDAKIAQPAPADAGKKETK